MFAILKTACGCEKVMHVRDFAPVIRVPILYPLPSYYEMSRVDAMEPVEFQVRLFRFVCRVGPESAEYREEYQRPTPPVRPDVDLRRWRPTVPHPLIQLDESLREQGNES